MKAINEIELDSCHTEFLNICFGDYPMEAIGMRVSEKITGFGSNINERILNFQDFIDLLLMQREESAGIEMHIVMNCVYKTIICNGLGAIFMDDIKLKIRLEDGEIEHLVRINSVYEYIHNRWMAVNFHGAMPHGEEGNQDTWAINEWKQKNEALERKIQEKTKELKQSLEDLKSTQKQLIQSEKMASLGELTAGIAHEIQNPLNFVNNFSEVSAELIEELEEEISSGNIEEIQLILKDIRDNLTKINHHGNRAGNIVKGMLQHSRESSGERVETDINQLVDEYLRLAYHGFRAKDKSFNCNLKTDFEESLPKVKIVPQDIGRVVLNIITNAFQTVTEKSRTDEHFLPEVAVSTSSTKNKIFIEISDNGEGMSESVKDKIFQPFFTTKPTGQGTGLGMSISYDIIKAHGGDIILESEAGEGSKFKILLPTKKS